MPIFIDSESTTNHLRYLSDKLSGINTSLDNKPYVAVFASLVIALEGGSKVGSDQLGFDSLREFAEVKTIVHWERLEFFINKIRSLKLKINQLKMDYDLLVKAVNNYELQAGNDDFDAFLFSGVSSVFSDTEIERLRSLKQWVDEIESFEPNWETLIGLRELILKIYRQIENGEAVLILALEELTKTFFLSKENKQKIISLDKLFPEI